MGAEYKQAHRSPIMGGTDGGVAVNTTVYARPNGSTQSANVLLRETRFPISGIVSDLYYEVSGPPGAGETFTATVMINGIATAITCQIAGAVDVTAEDLVNAVAIVAGDTLCIRLVSSLNAAVSQHHWGLVVRN